ncbi:MAG TPA: hypothetical protein VGF94_14760 [Kofleriaceae bacterium]|jgi:non-ribosomal peptide synthetase component F
MRDEQARRYARHLSLPDVGGLGQTALLVAAARLTLRESEPRAELIAATYLAAGGVGAVACANASDEQRADLAAHGADTHITADGTGRELALEPRPAWWPAAEGDGEALAFWRGALAATRWMSDVIAK